MAVAHVAAWRAFYEELGFVVTFGAEEANYVAVITPNPTADGCTSTHSDLKGTCCAVEDVGESCKGGPAAATPVQ